MAQQCFILHTNGTLEVFNADTERRQFLSRVLVQSKRTADGLSQDDREKLGDIMDGQIERVFGRDTGGLRTVHLLSIPVYLGTYGIDPK